MQKDQEQIIQISKEKLTQVCLKSYQAFINKEKIFKTKREEVLPQFNLPEGLEKNPKETANYLFILALMERKSLTRINIRNGRKTWENPQTKWIFIPEKSVKNLEGVTQICQENLQYMLNDFPKNYVKNMQLLLEKYNGDPRNIIHKQSIEQARKNLMEFHGIGTGIANLFINYLTDINLICTLNPLEARVKVDVHKARIPINTNCITGQDEYRRDIITKPLEDMYLQICKEQKLNAQILDTAPWIIGSEICAKRNYNRCLQDCPIEDLCTSCVKENDKTGKIIVHELKRDGKKYRVETRKHARQLQLFKF